VRYSSRKALVYYQDRIAGTITETAEGFQFIYDTDYLVGGTPISFHFPLQKAEFYNTQLPSFFENLTSEGWLLKLQSKVQKIDEIDTFGLLLANGRDLIGAVSVIPF
jgi:serine/threonine-protein kinase HipA